MTQDIVFEGSNLETAIQNACKALNIRKSQLKYDVVSFGAKGIFGIVGKRNAKIRVVAAQKKNQTTKTKESVDRDTPSKQAYPDTSNDLLSAKPADDPLDSAKNALQRIVEKISSDATIRAREDKDRIIINVEGGKSAVLIGKRGQTLEAIQYIVEKIVNKRHEQRVRVEIDIEGYLKNKHENLKRLALKLAGKAKRMGRPVSAGQMNSHDRRIVHLALKDHKDVRTQSVGNGYYRKLMIYPKRNRQGRHRA